MKRFNFSKLAMVWILALWTFGFFFLCAVCIAYFKFIFMYPDPTAGGVFTAVATVAGSISAYISPVILISMKYYEKKAMCENVEREKRTTKLALYGADDNESDGESDDELQGIY